MTISPSVAEPLICFVGPLPPPLHGMATVNKFVVEQMRLRTRVAALNTAPHRWRAGLGYHLAKALRAIAITAGVLAARVKGSRTFYASVDDGLGGIYTTIFVLVARVCGYRIFLHHHSFRYVDTRRRIMAILTKLAGSRCCHVVLCEMMAEKMVAHYQSIKTTMVVPNVVVRPPVSMRGDLSQPPGSPLTLGLLSNLMFEKGVAEFIAVVEQALASGVNVQGVLAGPAWNAKVETYITEAVARSEGSLRWIGPVSGQDKEDFFGAIDLFVFPTKYPSESFGLVLLEALVRGCPVVASDRGCICIFRPLTSATIIDSSADFVAMTVGQISKWAGDTDRSLIRSLARTEGGVLNDAHFAAVEQLVDTLLTS